MAFEHEPVSHPPPAPSPLVESGFASVMIRLGLRGAPGLRDGVMRDHAGPVDLGHSYQGFAAPATYLTFPTLFDSPDNYSLARGLLGSATGALVLACAEPSCHGACVRLRSLHPRVIVHG